MKIVFVSLLVALAVSTSCSQPHNGVSLRKGNAIDNLIRAALEYVRKQLKDHEPMKTPDIPRQNIHDDDSKIYLTADLTDVYVSKASDFLVDNIENNIISMWAKFGVTLPSMHLEGKYTVNGTFVGKDVKGQGTFSADVIKLVTNGFVQMDFIDHTLHMSDMKIDYSIQGFQFKEQGLVVEGMNEKQLEELFNKALLTFFQDNEPMVAGKISRQIKEEANEIVKGKTIEDVIEWLKNFIKHTV